MKSTGMHNDPNSEPNVVVRHAGPCGCGGKLFRHHDQGTGSHAAAPHQSKDRSSSDLRWCKTAAKGIASRNSSDQAILLSVDQVSMRALAYNVVPITGTIAGTDPLFP